MDFDLIRAIPSKDILLGLGHDMARIKIISRGYAFGKRYYLMREIITTLANRASYIVYVNDEDFPLKKELMVKIGNIFSKFLLQWRKVGYLGQEISSYKKLYRKGLPDLYFQPLSLEEKISHGYKEEDELYWKPIWIGYHYLTFRAWR